MHSVACLSYYESETPKCYWLNTLKSYIEVVLSFDRLRINYSGTIYHYAFK